MKGRHLKVAETDLAVPQPKSLVLLEGEVLLELFGPDGKLKERLETHNIITELGDEYYGERAAAIATPPDQVSGMRLGTGGATAASKTGAGAAIVTYIAGSNVAITAGFPTSALVAGKRRIQWKSSWAAGVATNTAISEAAITNETPLSNVAGVAGNTVARTIFSPAIDKQSGDTLDVTWSHDIGTP